MELVYLWVEDYKNIHKQGFNFSPRFNCEYDETNNELTIEENKDYVNIFPENINITAIVGKNGSGKSSILKSFLESFLNNKINASIFIDKDKELTHSNKNYVVIYWDYSITDEGFLEIEIDNKDSEYKDNKNYLIMPSKVDRYAKSKIDLKYDIQFLAKNILKNKFSFDIVKDFFEPKYIILATENDLKEYADYIDTEYKDFFIEYYGSQEDINIYKFKFTEENINKVNTIFIENENCDIELITEKNKKLIFLSFGEVQLLKILVNIQNDINYFTGRYSNLILLLDELELGLHPNWQKKVINFLTKLNISKNENIYFILTTHSPFLISDLPIQNIIFLDKDKNGNCQVVNGLKQKKQTFGTNIHALLSDGFFMKDGLMGEFAKSKINEIKKLYLLIQDKKVQEKLKNQKTKELAKKAFNRRRKRLWDIEKIIGEPYLQKIIKNYLDELEILFSDDNTLIDKELEEIEKRKRYLESLKK